MANVGFTDEFWPSVSSLDAKYNARVIEALNLFNRDAEHPNLHLKPLRKKLDGLWSIRAGRDVRVLIEKRGNTYVWLEAGMRRDIYDRAERGRFVVNEAKGFMGFVTARAEPSVAPPVVASAATPNVDAPGVLDHWQTGELQQAGLTSEEIALVRATTDEYELLEADLDEERLDLIIDMLATPPSVFLGEDHDAEDRFRAAIEAFGASAGVSQLYSADELEHLLSAPIEEWMVFLHPEQRSVVEARYRGPARVRGAAGTGKTVVGLHRAAELSKRYEHDGRVLFVTYSELLLPVLRNLFLRLPNAAPDRVDFHSMRTLAEELLAGEFEIADPTVADEAFNRAFDTVITPGSPLDGLSSSYLRAEVETVIRGRGHGSAAEYAEAQRRGRRVGFSQQMKQQAWELHLAWRAELGESRTLDDLLPIAVDRAIGSETWRCAVVDEAQDLTMVQLDVVRNLVATRSGTDRADGLMLCGDGAQKVRPGGYTLSQAGIEVRGRTSILRRNYRTTAEVMEAALAIAGAAEIVDLDEEFRRGELEPDSDRRGRRPVLVTCPDEPILVGEVIEQIDGLAADGAIDRGDIAVLTAIDEHDSIVERLGAAGLEAVDLETYDGTTTDKIKIGTWAASKGLEFKGVIVTGCGAATFPSPGGADEWNDEHEERRLLELSHLFVAMTRARDRLVLMGVSPLAPEVRAALHALDETTGGG